MVDVIEGLRSVVPLGGEDQPVIDEAATDMHAMRDALVKIAGTYLSPSSINASRMRDVAREALVSIGWDWAHNQPAEDLMKNRPADR